MATFVNEDKRERDTNDTKRKIDLENDLKDKHVSISPQNYLVFFNIILVYMVCLFLNLNNFLV